MLSQFLDEIKDKKIYIVGISGAEGAAAASFLTKYGLDKNTEATDFSTKNEFKKTFIKFHQALSRKGQKNLFKKISSSKIKIYFKEDYLKDIKKADIIFVSQGWIKHKANYPKLSNLFKAQKQKFLSMTKLYLELSKAQIIGVTGSNGKSTTARLIYETLKEGNKKTFFAGNDRSNIQILENIERLNPQDHLVLEISERQLLLPMEKSPHIAVITNIVPNHLDDHKNFKNYMDVKKRILKYQTKKDFAILNFDNKATKSSALKTKGRFFFFSRKTTLKEGAFLENDKVVIKIGKKKEVVANLAKIKMPGIHNLENILAASLAAKLAGAPIAKIKKVLENFKGIPERIEFIAYKQGRKFYYDIQSTTPDATEAAINTFLGKGILLILGGEDKGMDYRLLASNIKKNVKNIIIFPGSGSIKLKKELKKINFRNFKELDNLKSALSKSLEMSQKGDIILLSPACAFFKREFIEKPNISFYKLVKELR